MKDIERFKMQLNRPLPNEIVTAEQLDDEGRDFVAFASMLGVPTPAQRAALPSSADSDDEDREGG